MNPMDDIAHVRKGLRDDTDMKRWIQKYTEEGVEEEKPTKQALAVDMNHIEREENRWDCETILSKLMTTVPALKFTDHYLLQQLIRISITIQSPYLKSN